MSHPEAEDEPVKADGEKDLQRYIDGEIDALILADFEKFVRGDDA